MNGLTTSVLPHVPIYWEVFALLLRWASSVLVWLLAANLWPRNREFALTAALAFLVFPGFNQQWTSYLYSHFFAVICFLLLSSMCSIWAIRHPARRVPLTLAGVFLSALNLWMMEYFFTLELLRLLLILRVTAVAHPGESQRQLLRRTGLDWLPYVMVFGANILWRQFVFNNQIYQPTLKESFLGAPLAAIAELIRSIALQLYRTSIAAWIQVLQLPFSVQHGPRTIAYYTVVVLLCALAVGVGMALIRRRETSTDSGRWWPLGLGLAGMLLAGGPFLLTGLEVSLAYPANRFTLPFMLGVSLILAGLLAFVPPSVRMWMTIALISLGAGRQALWAEDYREDWITHKSIFGQMLWRAPGIKPNTLILMNEGALPSYADNSLIGGLNWIYDPGNRSPGLDYALFYPTSRLGGSVPSFEADQPIQYDFISEVFSGNTSQVLAFYYQPPGFLRLLGATIVATGAQEYRPKEFLYGQNDGIMTQLDLGKFLHERNDDAARWIAGLSMIQCVGSRNAENPDCSRICCQGGGEARPGTQGPQSRDGRSSTGICGPTACWRTITGRPGTRACSSAASILTGSRR